MKDTYYHATPYENLVSIVVDGILTVEVLIDSEKVEETFDHSLQFFKCKAFGYKGDIKPCEMINFFRCQL